VPTAAIVVAFSTRAGVAQGAQRQLAGSSVAGVIGIEAEIRVLGAIGKNALARAVVVGVKTTIASCRATYHLIGVASRVVTLADVTGTEIVVAVTRLAVCAEAVPRTVARCLWRLAILSVFSDRGRHAFGRACIGASRAIRKTTHVGLAIIAGADAGVGAAVVILCTSLAVR